jgi:hypothetical protein
MYSLDLNNPPRIGFTIVKSRIKKICKMAGTMFHSLLANCAQMCTPDCHEEHNFTADCRKENNRTAEFHKENNLTADCHSQEAKLESRWPRGYTCCGNPR